MFNKLRQEVTSNKAFYIIFMLLLVLPLFWFKKNYYILGEDDTGLVYYNPGGMLDVASSVWFSLDHLPRFEQFVGYATVFAAVIGLVKLLTFDLINVQLLSFGFILSFSFYFIVRTLQLLFDRKGSVAFYIAGLFYALSTYFVMVEYYYMLPSAYAIVLAPAVSYFLLKATLEESIKPLLVGSIWTFFLSRVLLTPTFINFFALLPVFLFIYVALNHPRKKLCILGKYFFWYIFFIVAINAMMIVPLLSSFFEKGSSALAQDIAHRNETSYIDNMLSYIESEIRLPRMVYYLLNAFPEPISKLQGFRNYGFYGAYLNYTAWMMFVIPVLTIIGLMKASVAHKKKVIGVLMMFIISFLLLTVDLFQWTKTLYYFLMQHTPIFNMNRIPSMKFHLPYIYYFSLLVGLAMASLFMNMKRQAKHVLVTLSFLVILINSAFFITGNVFTDKNDPVNASRAMDFNEDYKKLYTELPMTFREDTNLLLFPLGYAFGAFITGEQDSQYYRSTVTGFKTFTGLNLFGTLRGMWTVLDERIYVDVQDYYYNNNPAALLSLAQKINMRYIIYFKKPEELRKFAEVIPDNTYESATYYAPVDRTEKAYENDSYVLYKLENYDSISQFSISKQGSELDFKKVADFMYLLRVKTEARDDLFMHQGYSNLWNFYEISAQDFDCQDPQNFAKDYPGVRECRHLNNNIQGNKQLIALSFNKLVDLPHFRHNLYTNRWEVNTQGQYKYYVLVYDPQKFYIAGIFISFIVLIGYSIYLARHEK